MSIKLADGTLAQVGDGSTTRLYLGDLVFSKASNGTVTLESAGWEGGRLLNGSGTGNVLYYVTDHLGSTRVVKDGSGTIRQRFDYYPYGAVSRVYTSSSTTDSSEKRYRFGGKEIAGSALTELGGTGAAPAAPYLDFGARLICVTDHCYLRDGIWHLKHTWWYDMLYTDPVDLTPQREEDISRAAWVARSSLPPFLKNTYPSIQEVFREAKV